MASILEATSTPAPEPTPTQAAAPQIAHPLLFPSGTQITPTPDKKDLVSQLSSILPSLKYSGPTDAQTHTANIASVKTAINAQQMYSSKPLPIASKTNVAYPDATIVGNDPKNVRPGNYRGQMPDTLGENILEVIDPSGVSSWDDIYRSYNESGMSGKTKLEIVGAIPFLGKASKAARFLEAIASAVPKTGRQARNVRNSVSLLKLIGNYGPTAGRATDAIQAAIQLKEENTPREISKEEKRKYMSMVEEEKNKNK